MSKKNLIAVRADHTIAFDEQYSGTAGFVYLRNATVLVQKDRIVDIATGEDGVALTKRADVVYDLGESLLMPGLIDLEGLVDIDHLQLDSWWSNEHSARLEWSEEYARNPRDVLTVAERSTLRRYGLVQLILHGITSAMPISTEVHGAWAETHDDMLDTARIASELGIRTFLGPSYRSGIHVSRADGSRGIFWDEAKGEAAFADAVRFLDTARDLRDPLVTGVLVPCRVETVSDEILTRTAELSAEREVLVRAHAAQGLADEIEILKKDRGGVSPLDLLDRVGLLNDRLILAHGVYLDVHPDVHGEDRGDLARLAAAGAHIVHCPVTNARYAFLLEKLGQYLDAGVGVALGTDSFPPDLIRAIDTGAQLAKAQNDDLGAGLLAEYVAAATLGGASALRRPDLGRIAPDAQADLVAFSLADLRMGVIDDPIRALTLAGTGRDAHFSMVAGRVVMENGLVPGVDVEALRAEGQRIFEKLRAAYPERDALAGPEGSTVQDLFPPVFPTIGDQTETPEFDTGLDTEVTRNMVEGFRDDPNLVGLSRANVMRILVVNVNTTARITEAQVATARAVAAPGTEIVGLTPEFGAESVEGHFESYLAAVGVMDAVTRYNGEFDAVIQAGFGEHGREGLQELLSVPVVDITEAAASTAMLLGKKYSVITTLSRTVSLIEERLLVAGLHERCASVRAADLPVLEIEDSPERTLEAILAEAKVAIEQDRAEVLILGCGGMTGIADRISEILGVPVIDGVAAAIKIAEGLVSLGLGTSKVHSFAAPRAKLLKGWPLGQTPGRREA